MDRFDIDAQYSRERYADYINAQRVSRLIREAHAAKQPAQPARPESLIMRIYTALRRQQIAHA
jgi:hypothetical protein